MRKSTSPGFLQLSVWDQLSRWGVASKPFEGSSQLCRGEPSRLFLKERKVSALYNSMFFCGGFLISTFSGWFPILTFFRLVLITNFSVWFSISIFFQAGFQRQLAFKFFSGWFWFATFFRAGFHFLIFSRRFSISTFSGWVSISTFFLAGFQFQLFFRQVFNCNFFRQVFNWPQWCLGRSTRSLGSPGTSGEKTQSPVLRGRLTEAAKKLAVKNNFIWEPWKGSSDPGKFKNMTKTDNSLGPYEVSVGREKTMTILGSKEGTFCIRNYWNTLQKPPRNVDEQ